MATQKALKLKEDAHHKHLEDSILGILEALEALREQQAQMLEMMRKTNPQHGFNKRSNRK